MPSLAELAKRAQLSPSHFHRLFTSLVGLTPRAYAVGQRAKRLRVELMRGRQVTAAMYDAGFESSGRFYAASHALLGMTPSRYRAGGMQTDLWFAVGHCSLGAILVAQSLRGVCAILLGDDAELLVRDLQARFPRAHLIGGDAAFERGGVDCRGLCGRAAAWAELAARYPGDSLSATGLACAAAHPRWVDGDLW
jgi:AraC family transcriptional regulator of adaptative response/methylated-DNA-[protein]-cysteine methyltransferase